MTCEIGQQLLRLPEREQGIPYVVTRRGRADQAFRSTESHVDVVSSGGPQRIRDSSGRTLRYRRRVYAFALQEKGLTGVSGFVESPANRDGRHCLAGRRLPPLDAPRTAAATDRSFSNRASGPG
jgi:hypothetical protein